VDRAADARLLDPSIALAVRFHRSSQRLARFGGLLFARPPALILAQDDGGMWDFSPIEDGDQRINSSST